MKHLLTLTALLISSLAMGQMPYNPDSNGDDLIGATDLISVLGLYNTLMVDSSLTCDYQGTELESWVGGLFDGTLLLDSVYVEYLLIDSVETYLPGCPDPVFIETVLDRGYMCDYPSFQILNNLVKWELSCYYLGYNREFTLLFFPGYGSYQFKISDNEIAALTNYSAQSSTSSLLPFPESWTLDENGIQVDFGLTSSNNWILNCEHFRLIPYWSEAE